MSQTTAYVPLRDMQDEAKTFFPSEHSFRWFIRNHRENLAKAGAMIQVANRLLFKPEAFVAYVIKDGAERVGGAA